MIKFVCDRCRCEVYMTFMPFNREAVLIDGAYRKKYDLCKKCMYEVRMFITEQTVTETAERKTEPQTETKWLQREGEF